MIVSDLAVIRVTPEGLVLQEVAPRAPAKGVQNATAPKLKVADSLIQVAF
jgi:acyl CoA:acetate/3-ketoacid CoA transferase beta subunit